MIGRIAGTILHRAMDHVLIDVRGVGYIVHVSTRTASGLPPVGEACALYTDLLVREDLLQLFGFPTLLEKEWHRLLTSVQGIGARRPMLKLAIAPAVDRPMPGSSTSFSTSRGNSPPYCSTTIFAVFCKLRARAAPMGQGLRLGRQQWRRLRCLSACGGASPSWLVSSVSDCARGTGRF